jgi:hypothetical protein
LHAHQQLIFGDNIADAGMDIHYSAGCQRDDGNVARDIRGNRSGDIQFGRAVMLFGGRQGKLLWVIHLDQIGVGLTFD